MFYDVPVHLVVVKWENFGEPEKGFRADFSRADIYDFAEERGDKMRFTGGYGYVKDRAVLLTEFNFPVKGKEVDMAYIQVVQTVHTFYGWFIRIVYHQGVSACRKAVEGWNVVAVNVSWQYYQIIETVKVRSCRSYDGAVSQKICVCSYAVVRTELVKKVVFCICVFIEYFVYAVSDKAWKSDVVTGRIYYGYFFKRIWKSDAFLFFSSTR